MTLNMKNCQQLLKGATFIIILDLNLNKGKLTLCEGSKYFCFRIGLLPFLSTLGGRGWVPPVMFAFAALGLLGIFWVAIYEKHIMKSQRYMPCDIMQRKHWNISWHASQLASAIYTIDFLSKHSSHSMLILDLGIQLPLLKMHWLYFSNKKPFTLHHLIFHFFFH